MRIVVAVLLVGSTLNAKFDVKLGHDPISDAKHPLLPRTDSDSLYDCLDKIKKGGPKIILTQDPKAISAAEIARLFQLKKSPRQKCVIGIDGVYCSDIPDNASKDAISSDTKNTRGIEDPFPQGLTLLLRQYIELAAAGDTPNPQTRTDLISRIQQPYLQEAWDRLRKKNTPFDDSESSELEKVAKVIDATIRSTPEAARSHEASIPNSPWHKNPEAVKTILRAWATEYAAMATSGAYQAEKMPPSNLREAVRKLLSGEDLSGFTLVSEKWHNDYLARTIARIYCQFLTEGHLKDKRDLHLILGHKHPPALIETLIAASNGNVTVEERDSSAETPVLQQELNKLEAKQ